MESSRKVRGLEPDHRRKTTISSGRGIEGLVKVFILSLSAIPFYPHDLFGLFLLGCVLPELQKEGESQLY